jgi:hypothetical protein
MLSLRQLPASATDSPMPSSRASSPPLDAHSCELLFNPLRSALRFSKLLAFVYSWVTNRSWPTRRGSCPDVYIRASTVWSSRFLSSVCSSATSSSRPWKIGGYLDVPLFRCSHQPTRARCSRCTGRLTRKPCLDSFHQNYFQLRD